MTTPTQPPERAAPSRPDPIAVSPAIGPLPAVYVPRTPGEAASTSLTRQAWRAWRARLARRAARRPARPRG